MLFIVQAINVHFRVHYALQIPLQMRHRNANAHSSHASPTFAASELSLLYLKLVLVKQVRLSHASEIGQDLGPGRGHTHGVDLRIVDHVVKQQIL